jgi:hypothetical protein
MAERGTDRCSIERISVTQAVGSGTHRGLSIAWQNVIGLQLLFTRFKERDCMTMSAARLLTGFDCVAGIDNSQNQGACARGVSQPGLRTVSISNPLNDRSSSQSSSLAEVY